MRTTLNFSKVLSDETIFIDINWNISIRHSKAIDFKNDNLHDLIIIH